MAVRLQGLKFDCRDCSGAMKEDRGCENNSPIPGRWEIGGDQYRRCPIKLVTHKTKAYLNIYNAMKAHSALYYAGGLADQPGKLIDVYGLIEREARELK